LAAGATDDGTLAAEGGWATDVPFPGRADAPSELTPGVWKLVAALQIRLAGADVATLYTTLVGGRAPALVMMPNPVATPADWKPVATSRVS
jgi:hypothetical protein